MLTTFINTTLPHPQDQLDIHRSNARTPDSTRKLFILSFLCLSLFCLSLLEAADQAPPPLQRVVVYLPLFRPNRDPAEMLSRLDLRTLTHLNLAFINPDSEGSFSAVEAHPSWRVLIEHLPTLHVAGIKVLASIGGGGWRGSEPLRPHLVEPSRRAAYVASLVAFVKRWKLDGIDVDIEGPLVKDAQLYPPFVIELGDALLALGLRMTAAYSGNTTNVSDEMLARIEFINTMAYDESGSWSPHRVIQHSSMEHAQRNIDVWLKRGVPPEKIVLGVPFYGWRFFLNAQGQIAGDSKTWAQIVAEHPSATEVDEYGNATTSAGRIFYNGPTTIAAKTLLARRYGGIMVWEIGQDALGEHSLFAVIRANTGR